MADNRKTAALEFSANCCTGMFSFVGFVRFRLTEKTGNCFTELQNGEFDSKLSFSDVEAR